MPPSTAAILERALAEADAMRRLAELLAALPDDEARARVLRWSQEHFRLVPLVSFPATDDRQRPAAPSGGEQADPALTIDDDLFDTPSKKPEPIHCDGVAAEQTARLDGCDQLELDGDLFEADEIDDEDLEVRATDLEPARAAESKPAGLDSLLRDFVADFQRLALAWQLA